MIPATTNNNIFNTIPATTMSTNNSSNTIIAIIINNNNIKKFIHIYLFILQYVKLYHVKVKTISKKEQYIPNTGICVKRDNHLADNLVNH